MIITLFAIVTALAVILFALGHYTDAPVIQIAGSVFLFITGLVLLFGGLQYPTGHSEGVTYSYSNVSGTIKVNETTTTSQISYTAYTSEILAGIDITHIMGFLLSVLGILAFMNVYLNLGGKD